MLTRDNEKVKRRFLPDHDDESSARLAVVMVEMIGTAPKCRDACLPFAHSCIGLHLIGPGIYLRLFARDLSTSLALQQPVAEHLIKLSLRPSDDPAR